MPDSFADILARLDDGDEEAATVVFNRFGQELVRRARARLNARVRQKVDPEDVVQSVFRSFFARQAAGQFELDGWDSMLGLLVRITLRKCGRQAASLNAACRDITRERAQKMDSQASAIASWEAVAREPTPVEATTFVEVIEQVMGQLTERDQEILTLRMQGCTIPEISREIGRTERTVHRALANLKTNLEKMDP